MNNDNLNDRKNFLIHAAYFLIIGSVIFLIFKYLIPFFAPFLFGFFIAFILKPFSRYLCRSLHLEGKFCGAFVVIFSYLVFIVILYFVGGKVVDVLKDFASSAMMIYSDYIVPLFYQINDLTVNSTSNLSPDFASHANQFTNSLVLGLQNSISSMSQSLFTSLAKTGMALPNFLMGLVFAVMSSIFISSDYDKIASFISKLFPKRLRPKIFETKGYAVDSIIHYIRAYLILMIITFTELSISFFIIGADNPIGTAAAISICDALPLLGIGIILIPWCLLSFAMGNLSFAISLLVIYVIIGIIRGFLEPKILGKQLGLHPLATLISVYVGLKLLGVLGMILFPILLQILVSLYKNSVFYSRDTN